jgi:hypothetical protein
VAALRGEGSAMTKVRRSTADYGRDLYANAAPLGETPQPYLLKRGIDTTRFADLSGAVRFAQAVRHKETDTDMPALIFAATDNDGVVTGVQRRYLSPDCSAKAIVAPKSMPLGEIKGSAIRLAPAAADGDGVLMITEGPEDAMTAMLAVDMRWPAWAAGGAGFMPSIVLPPEVKTVVLIADNDARGREDAHNAAFAFPARGKRVLIARPPKGVKDINDLVGGWTGDGLALAYVDAKRVIDEAVLYEPVPSEESRSLDDGGDRVVEVEMGPTGLWATDERDRLVRKHQDIDAWIERQKERIVCVKPSW